MSLALATRPDDTYIDVEPQRPRILSKQEKAAVLLSVLIKAGATPDLDKIDTPALKQTVDIMATFGDVDRTTVDEVILEFLTELGEFGLSMRGELEETLEALKGHVSDKVLEKIRKAYVRSPSVDVWTRIASAEPGELRRCLEAEHTQIAATVLSKIPSTQAAEILGAMEPEVARETMLAIVNAGETSPETLEIIGQSIADTLFDEDGDSVFDKTPVERAGDIMNFAQSDIRTRLMDEFSEKDPETAEKIRKVMFTFPDIPERILPRDVSAITRAVPPETLLRALKGAESEAPEAAEFILSSLSTRAAAQLREDLAELEPVKKKEMETAMNEVIVAIRELESEGTIKLIMEEEE